MNVLRAILLSAALTSAPAALAEMLSLAPQNSGDMDFGKWLQLNQSDKPDNNTNYETEFQSPCDDPTNTDPDCVTKRLGEELKNGSQG